MNKVLIQDDILFNIATSIRAKNNTTESIYPQDMPTEIHKINATYFKATGNLDKIITIKLKGKGEIAFYNNRFYRSANLTKDEEEIITFALDDNAEVLYYIQNFENIFELDISSNGVTEFVCNEPHNQLNKLVAHTNNITNLKVDNLKELQFLHIFNNPICENLEKMKFIIHQLPDRNNKPFGSIILYDWVNLGLCGYRNPEDGVFYYDKDFIYP